MGFSAHNDRTRTIHNKLLIVDASVNLDFPGFRVVWKRFNGFFYLDVPSCENPCLARIYVSLIILEWKAYSLVMAAAVLTNFDFANCGSCDHPGTA